MRKTDISDFTDISENPGRDYSGVAGSVVKNTFLLIWKAFLTLLAVLCVAGVIIGISMVIYVASIAQEPTGIDLHSAKLNLTSFIYVNDENGNPKELMQLYHSENRVNVDFDNIPENMKNAIVAIEDKRFYEHHGVDWYRTGAAVLSLSTGGSQFGGSTITQQLIKNITSDDDVSITRKLKEIFRALNLEREFTKDEILEAYLNTVNFGGNNDGIQAAATAYFDKDVKDLTLAECAAIVGITQNPSQYNPLVFPEQNKQRRETVLQAMYDQGLISQDEYTSAMEESEHMQFVQTQDYIEEDSDDVQEEEIQNWYIDLVFDDLTRELAEYLDISTSAAADKIYTEGLKVYCAMDTKVQEQMEKTVREYSGFYYYPEIECGFCMMDYDGRVIAVVGSNKEKEANLLFSRATDSVLQPGSTIKGVSAYPLAIENGNLYYSAIVRDVPIDGWFPDTGAAGPNNWYLSSYGNILLPTAIELSSNQTVANVLNDLVDPSGQDGVRYSYNYAVTKLGWSHLSAEDASNMAGLSIGGFNGGVTVREMAKAYTLLGNGGKSYDSYTYYYVTDYDGNIIIDHREQDPIQALTAETAAVMNRLLNFNIQTSHSTNAGETRIDGWDIIGKTGTTDADTNSWFCGCSPYCSAAIWIGYDKPKTVEDTTLATKLWKILMQQYLEGKPHKDYIFPDDLIVCQYCPYTGLLANTGCGGSYYGYYSKSNLPEYCTSHYGYNIEYTTWGALHEANAESTVSTAATSSMSDLYNNYYNNYDYDDGTSSSADDTTSYDGDISNDDYDYDYDDDPSYWEEPGDVGDGDVGDGDVGGGDVGGGDVGGGDVGGGDVGGGDVGGGDAGGGDAGGGDAPAE